MAFDDELARRVRRVLDGEGTVTRGSRQRRPLFPLVSAVRDGTQALVGA